MTSCTADSCTLTTMHVCKFRPGPDTSWAECSSGHCGVCQGCESRANNVSHWMAEDAVEVSLESGLTSLR